MFAKKILSACVCSALLMSFAAGGGAFAAVTAASSDIQVKKFEYLDKEYDRISLDSADSPDGIRDGHLSLLIDAGEGTEIKSITMKGADAQGNEVNRGIWKTWKDSAADTSYLLVVVQDGKTINSTFTKTLGSFKGVAQFELYASDNNGMKPGEYYYLEIVTNKGTVKSDITPYAENVTSYAPVAIREFSWKDLTSDQTGIAKFGPDGSPDAHFKLKLNFAQKTDVLSVILRGTDKDGNPAGGIWRTNRAGSGWLLGIAQGKTVVTPGFKDDVKAPVGAFRGSVDFDLYAGNNGSIKNGEYYVVEVETSFGTVMTNPVKFGDPASNYVNDAPLGFKTIGLKLNSVKASVDEKNYTLEVAPFKQEGRTMVPIRFIAEALGAKVDWNPKERRVTLTKDDTKIELIIDKKEAYVNGVATMLDAPAVIRNNVTLLPVRFVSENMKMKVFFDEGEIVITDATEQ
ncbi:copper amine oxidase N-terminal domain-containing protein [Paenibacillus pedocola]|uniref:copper amine oxidase N-terminal domain-containing protein n=1 Tax=Paenibacillus pedocola TaxID=3242193 RepID=UPI0028779323|nr:copper amine oxidase N-terminal domain-containing protein [Paenibacillus typhae]